MLGLAEVNYMHWEFTVQIVPGATAGRFTSPCNGGMLFHVARVGLVEGTPPEKLVGGTIEVRVNNDLKATLPVDYLPAPTNRDQSVMLGMAPTYVRVEDHDEIEIRFCTPDERAFDEQVTVGIEAMLTQTFHN